MIKNILFDMGGVVFRQNTQEACRRFGAMGIDTDRYMGEYGQKEFFLDLETGKIDADEFCRQMARVTGKGHISYDEAEYCWLGFIENVPDENLRHLQELRKSYRLGLLSNTNPFIMGYTRSKRFSHDGRPITDFFDDFYCSYEMRVCKPSAEIYLNTLEKGGINPNETIFVDDSMKNIEAAQAVGIHGLHVPSNGDWMKPLSEMLKQL